MIKPAAPSADHMAHHSADEDTVQKLKTKLYALPDLRQQRVDALKRAVHDGSYKISPHAVATAMLSDHGPKMS